MFLLGEYRNELNKKTSFTLFHPIIISSQLCFRKANCDLEQFVRAYQVGKSSASIRSSQLIIEGTLILNICAEKETRVGRSPKRDGGGGEGGGLQGRGKSGRFADSPSGG